MISCNEYPIKKHYSHQKRGGTINKSSIEEKGKYKIDLENVHRVIKKITNEIIDVKRNIGENYSTQIPYQIVFRKLVEKKPLELPPPPPNLNIELDDVGMDNFFTYHQENHSKKKFPQWMNAMNLVEINFFDECTKSDEQIDNIETN